MSERLQLGGFAGLLPRSYGREIEVVESALRFQRKP